MRFYLERLSSVVLNCFQFKINILSYIYLDYHLLLCYFWLILGTSFKGLSFWQVLYIALIFHCLCKLIRTKCEYDGKYLTKNNFMFKIICPVICLFNCTCEIYFCQTFQYMARHCLVSGRYFEPCIGGMYIFKVIFSNVFRSKVYTSM